MKTKEELNALKQEAKALNAKFKELTDEEAAEVLGGSDDILRFAYLVGSVTFEAKLAYNDSDAVSLAPHR